MLEGYQQPTRKTLAVLGSTGSIGTQALNVCRHHPEAYEIIALAGGKQIDKLLEQIKEFSPLYVSVADDQTRQALKEALSDANISLPLEILTTEAGGLETLATLPDLTDVLMGVVGILGLAPSLAALKAGKRLLTANKETFVAGGHLVQPYLSNILPFDSEHSALFQSLHHSPIKSVRKMWITASGGPFRGYSLEQLKQVTKADALKHPNWVMGQKVTIDSASLMNKGLELIEAKWLFGLNPSQIEVLVHPQSIVHGMVEYIDGSVMAQLAPADMRIPIQVAMSWPDRWDGAYMKSHLNLSELSRLDFHPPDEAVFPCLRLARHAMEAGSRATTILNACDEIAVQAFLDERLHFTEIPCLIERVLEKSHHSLAGADYPELDELLDIDAWARQESLAYLKLN
ncbi:MAG: 1-deoxy-D-xylulose-5-phosphate reductoisomerase [Vampirovibrionales bacterium]